MFICTGPKNATSFFQNNLCINDIACTPATFTYHFYSDISKKRTYKLYPFTNFAVDENNQFSPAMILTIKTVVFQLAFNLTQHTFYETQVCNC